MRLALFLTLIAAPVWAVDCRLALLLGFDISSSVDADEDALQRGGMVAALRSAEVAQAFFTNESPVALAVFEWSGRYNQVLLMDWRIIAGPADLEAAARRIETSARSYNEFPTAMGEALKFGAQILGRAPHCLKQTIDIAGDGANNEGPGPRIVYRSNAFREITVNGLVVANATEFQSGEAITAYFEDEVRHGPGAFVIVADGFQDYTRAMRAKLIREVTPLMLGKISTTTSEDPRG